jgi:hypothetical protein
MAWWKQMFFACFWWDDDIWFLYIKPISVVMSVNMYVIGIAFAYFCDFSIRFWNSSNNVVYFHFIAYIGGRALRVQQYFSYIQGGCFYWCRKPDPPEYLEKTIQII